MTCDFIDVDEHKIRIDTFFLIVHVDNDFFFALCIIKALELCFFGELQKENKLYSNSKFFFIMILKYQTLKQLIYPIIRRHHFLVLRRKGNENNDYYI